MMNIFNDLKDTLITDNRYKFILEGISNTLIIELFFGFFKGKEFNFFILIILF